MLLAMDYESVFNFLLKGRYALMKCQDFGQFPTIIDISSTFSENECQKGPNAYPEMSGQKSE